MQLHWKLASALGALLLTACSGPGISGASDIVAASTTARASAVPTSRALAVDNAPPLVATAGEPYTYLPHVLASAGPLTFSIVNLPGWANFDAITGLLSGTPGAGDATETPAVTLLVSDGSANGTVGPFRINVVAIPARTAATSAAANRVPKIEGMPPASVGPGASYRFSPTAWDDDGDRLTFAIANKPAWLTFDSRVGSLSGIPTALDAGRYTNILIVVSDGKETALLPGFTIQVGITSSTTAAPSIDFIAERPPSVAGEPSMPPPTITPPAMVEPPAEEPPAARLPAVSPPATAPPLNLAPQISGGASGSASVGKAYLFAPVTSDPNGDTLSFSISNKPAWARFSISTGQLSGTPAPADIGTYAGILISVSDGSLSAILPAFTLTVTDPNHAPALSGPPGTSTRAGVAYDFQPGASDADGDTLAFSITNRPSWATFSTTTGRLSGTPVAANVGAYAGIVISADDGHGATSSLSPFSITVAGPGNGTAELTWAAPTHTTAGAPLSNLSGYRLYYGPSQSEMTRTLDFADASKTSHTMSGLASGTWYFAITATTSAGTESAFSNIGVKTIP